MKNRNLALGLATLGCVMLPDFVWSDAAAPAPAPAAPRVFVVDLTDATTSHTFDVEPGKFIVRFLNRAPGRRDYHFVSETESLLLKPLDRLEKAPPIVTQSVVPDPCDELEQATTKLMSPILVEAGVPKMKASVERWLKAAGPFCKAPIIEDANSALAETTRDVPVQLEDGQAVMMRLSRDEPASDDAKAGKKTWSIELSTIGSGRWLTTFGYSFGGFTWDKDEKFFAKTAGDAFEVTQEQQRGGLAYVPTVFFTWLTRNQLRKPVAVGPAAGLGFGSATPTPMVGVAVTYRQNVSLVAGALLRRVTRLSGAYTVGQSLNETVPSDSLQQSVYRPGIFVSVAFRFGSNPFSGADGAEKATGKGKTDAAAADATTRKPKDGK